MQVQESADTTADAVAHPRRGRPRDASRDEAILDAARDLLAQVGYEGMTMGAVAARVRASKATLYRRWPSKSDLAIDAVMCGRGPRDISADDVPDTGSLSGDLRALESVRHTLRTARTDDLIPGLMAEVRRDPELAREFHRSFVGPKIDLLRALLERARERGEIPPGRDLDLASTVIPALVSYRKVVEGVTVDPEYVDRLHQEVLVPLVTAPLHDV